MSVAGEAIAPTDAHDPRSRGTRRARARVERLLFGTDMPQDLNTRFTLVASLVYLVAIPAQWLVVEQGYVPAWEAWVVIAMSLVGAVGFYAVIRLGWTRHRRDPAMVMVQMIHALVSLGLAYVVNWHVRASLLMIMAQVLVFGAFNIAPKTCRALGFLAVVIVGAAMTIGHLRNPGHYPLQVEAIHFCLAALVLPLVALQAGQLSQLRIDRLRQRTELRDALERLERVASHDELTGLPNRRHMQEWVTREVSRARRAGEPISLALIDLDHFKLVNDRHGHAVGDMALRIFAREGRSGLRESDLLARWGGEEFLLLSSGTYAANLQLMLERLRAHLADPLVWVDCPQAQVRFSVGLTTLKSTEALEEALQRADGALYEAKRLGRDRTVVADAESIKEVDGPSTVQATLVPRTLTRA